MRLASLLTLEVLSTLTCHTHGCFQALEIILLDALGTLSNNDLVDQIYGGIGHSKVELSLCVCRNFLTVQHTILILVVLGEDLFDLLRDLGGFRLGQSSRLCVLEGLKVFVDTLFACPHALADLRQGRLLLASGFLSWLFDGNRQGFHLCSLVSQEFQALLHLVRSNLACLFHRARSCVHLGLCGQSCVLDEFRRGLMECLGHFLCGSDQGYEFSQEFFRFGLSFLPLLLNFL
mmetsp:Transcript_103957/g.260698  ORF Transcript_103957/g.260698 Transcript_103957/m.260698 type:complete len:233 (+) Transcript_103957:1255-1953(+)